MMDPYNPPPSLHLFSVPDKHLWLVVAVVNDNLAAVYD